MSVWQLLFLCIPLYYALRYMLELFRLPDLRTRAVFITGCDTGFGRLLALRLARNGILAFAGCLTAEGKAKLAAEAEMLGPPNERRLIPLQLDITDEESVQKAVRLVEANMPEGLWALVNNAGVFSCYGPDAWTSIEEYKASMEVNCWGCIRCTHAFLPLLKRSQGRIVSVSSVAGRVSVPCGAPYAVAKYGVEAYMDAIRLELDIYGIKCCILEPGIYRTKLIDEREMEKRVDSVWNNLSPDLQAEYGQKYKDEFVCAWNSKIQMMANDRVEEVVDAYWHAITARFPRSRYRVGWDAILIYIPHSFLPTALGDAIFRLLASSGKQIIPAVIEEKRRKEMGNK